MSPPLLAAAASADRSQALHFFGLAFFSRAVLFGRRFNYRVLVVSEQTTTTEPILPQAKMNLVPGKAPVTGRVVSNDRCRKGKSASFVRHLVVDVSGTPLVGNFLVGRLFGVIPPGVDEKGKPHKVRLFLGVCSRGRVGHRPAIVLS